MTWHWIPQRDENWHRLRSHNVGSSEVAALFGQQADFAQSHFTLHAVKAGLIPPPPVDDSPNSRVWMGRMLEPVIGQMAAEYYGWTITAPGPYCVDDEIEGMAASLDGVIAEPGEEETRLGFRGPGLLELKYTQWVAHNATWIGNEPPYQVLLQMQHGLGASGLSWGVVVSLVGEIGLTAYRYKMHPTTVGMIRDRVEEFWSRVREGRPPNTDGSQSTANALKAMFPERNTDVILDLTGNKAADLLAHEVILTSANLAASKDAYEAARNEMNWFLKDHANAETDGHWIRVTKNNRLKVSPKPEAMKPKPKRRR